MWCDEEMVIMVESFWKDENGKGVKRLEGIEKKKWRKGDSFWMKEDGKGVKGLEGIGLKKVEAWRFWCVVLWMFDIWELGVLADLDEIGNQGEWLWLMVFEWKRMEKE